VLKLKKKLFRRQKVKLRHYLQFLPACCWSVRPNNLVVLMWIKWIIVFDLIRIVWLLLPNTQHGWFVLKNSFFTFCLPNRLTHQLFLYFHCYLIQPTNLNLLPWVMKRIQLVKYDLERSICGCLMNDQSNKSYTFIPKRDNIRRKCGKDAWWDREQINEDLLGSSPTCEFLWT